MGANGREAKMEKSLYPTYSLINTVSESSYLKPPTASEEKDIILQGLRSFEKSTSHKTEGFIIYNIYNRVRAVAYA